MLLRAGILLVLLVSVQAQPPRSSVLAAISPSSAPRPLPDLIRGLDADGRTKALDALDRLDRSALDAAGLAELSEAYRLLGRNEDALKAARELSARDPGGVAGDAQTILALAQSGDYAAAQAVAESGLKRLPGDKSLLALLHQVKGRGAPVAPAQAAATAGRGAVPPPPPAADARPYVLRVKAGKNAPPPLPASTGESAYLAPGAKKASDGALMWGGLWNLAAYKLDSESPTEIKRMAALRAKLAETETGRALVADLGGWEKIERDVDVRFAKVWNDGTNAYARPFLSPDSKGRRSALVLNAKLLAEPDAVTVPILAHELSHIRDFQRHSPDHGLAIPSEYAAHRTQIQVFEEMKAKMTPAEITEMKKNPRARYQNFIALLWEDHLLQRYKTSEEMAAAIGPVSKFAEQAKAVFLDLQSGKIGPGGPQLDYHLNGENGGLYRNLSAEKDIVDLISEREESGNYDAELRRKDRETLMKRAVLLGQSDKRDAEFRAKHGFSLEAGK